MTTQEPAVDGRARRAYPSELRPSAIAASVSPRMRSRTIGAASLSGVPRHVAVSLAGVCHALAGAFGQSVALPLGQRSHQV